MEKVYTPGRDIVVSTVDAIKTEIKDCVASSEGDLVVDFRGVEMVDSKGIGLLISTFNSLTKSERKLRLVNTPGEIRDLFRMMRLNQHFSIE